MAAEDSRDREIADLKARVDAMQRPGGGSGPPPKRRGGCLPVLGMGLLLLFLATMVVTKINPGAGDAAGAAGPDLKPLEIHCDDVWAGRVRSLAEKSGVVRGQANSGLDLIVVVNPFRWSGMGLESQRALGLALSCQIHDGFGAFTVKFRFNREGQDVLRLGHSELWELARSRFAALPTTPAPTGFRDALWGSRPAGNLKAAPGSESVWTDAQMPPPAFLGVAPADEDYIFDHGRLFGGDVYLKGPAAYGAMKAALAKAYGPPSSAQVGEIPEVYLWNWPRKKISVRLTYDSDKDSVIVHYEKAP